MTDNEFSSATNIIEINNPELSAVESPKYTKKYGFRHIQALLLFLMFTISYSLRVNISVAIVAMVDNSENPDFEQYDWNSSTQSIILSSFFWGYVVSQLPSGPLARRYGAKIIIFYGLLLGGIFNLVVPLAASIGGWEIVVICRVLFGITQGFLYPCTHALIVKWAPANERGTLTTLIYGGSQAGTVLMLAVSGFLASSTGWPSIFYISGALGIVWAIVWYFYGANEPADSKYILAEEIEFIKLSCGSNDMKTLPKSIPWKSIFKSTPLWALLIVHCGHNWGVWTLFTNIPTYMKNVLDYDIKANALLSAVPYLTMWILSFFFTFLADNLNKRNVITPVTSRKLFQSIGHWIPMIMLIGLGFVTQENREIAVLLLTLCVGVSASTYVGYMLNHMDLSPNFAGTLMGITNFAGNGVSILAPLLVGFVVENDNDPLQWRYVFFIAAGIYLVGNSIFVIFGQATIQPWNNI